MLTWAKNVETFLGCDSDYENAEAVIFGAPYDGTTSYRPGTRFASRIMRGESYSIETFSPYQNRELTDHAVFDGGDLDFPFGHAETILAMIEQTVTSILADGKKSVMIGGEHLVTLGSVKAAAARYPDLHLVQFDAHTDLREDYLGEKLSHATVIRRCWDLLGDGRIYQFGIRSGEKSEFEWGSRHVFCNRFNFGGIDSIAKSLSGKPVYLTIDLDVLDPSAFPGTGTPEAGGVSFTDLLQAILALKGLNVVACDINELSPPFDQSGISTATALKVLRELLLCIL